jgi:hypothetical protein
MRRLVHGRRTQGPQRLVTEPAARHSADGTPSRSRRVALIDRTVARLLCVQPEPRKADAATGDVPFETPLLVAGLRCSLRYLVLPLALPLLGVATGAAVGIVTWGAFGLLFALDVVAVGGVVASLRRLWRFQHPRRWQYLPVALVLTLLVAVFLVNDARVLVIR